MGIFSGLFGPKVEQIDVREAQRRLLSSPSPLIVDVRQPSETAETVKGAVLIPLTDFSRRMSELPKDRPILTICASSHRSPMAAKQLRKAGYDVVDVKGGMQAWQQARLPVVKRKKKKN